MKKIIGLLPQRKIMSFQKDILRLFKLLANSELLCRMFGSILMAY